MRPFFTIHCSGKSQTHLDWDIASGLVMSGLANQAVYSIPKMIPKQLPIRGSVSAAKFMDESTIALATGRIALFDLRTSVQTDTGVNRCNALTRSYNRDFCLGALLAYGPFNNSTLFSVGKTSATEFVKMDFSGIDGFAVSSRGQYVTAARRRFQLAVLHRGTDRSWKTVFEMDHDDFPWKYQTPAAYFFPAADPPVLLASFFLDIPGRHSRENRLYDLTTRELVRTVTWPHAVTQLILDPQGRELCTGGLDGLVRGYDARTLELLYEQRCHDRDITALAYRADGGALATGDASGLIRVWRLEGGRPTECLHEMICSPGAIEGLDFNPSGDSLLAVSDGQVRLWDVK